MFIEHLRTEDLKDFSKELTAEFTDVEQKKWKLVIQPHFSARRLFIYLDSHPNYEVFVELHDFTVFLIFADNIQYDTIANKFFDFMHRKFGEEYKNALEQLH